MRCLTLAETLRAHGKTCLFVCRDHPGNLAHFVKDRGFSIRLFPVMDTGTLSRDLAGSANPSYAEWLGADWERDRTDIIEAIADDRPQWLVADHYAIDYRWETSLRPHCDRILSIDDLADRRHDCDLLVDQTLGRDEDEYRTRVPEDCRILAGAQFALLRSRFAEMRQVSLKRRRRPELRHILIAMGASDPENVTGKILACIGKFNITRDVQITVVLSSAAPYLESVRQQIEAAASPVTLAIDATNMPDILAITDLALGAAGSSAWERCCLGVPSLMAVLADNQRRIAQELERAGAAQLFDPDDCNMLRTQLLGLTEDPSTLANLSRKASLVTDGEGAGYIASHMLDRMS